MAPFRIAFGATLLPPLVLWEQGCLGLVGA